MVENRSTPPLYVRYKKNAGCEPAGCARAAVLARPVQHLEAAAAPRRHRPGSARARSTIGSASSPVILLRNGVERLSQPRLRCISAAGPHGIGASATMSSMAMKRCISTTAPPKKKRSQCYRNPEKATRADSRRSYAWLKNAEDAALRHPASTTLEDATVRRGGCEWDRAAAP